MKRNNLLIYGLLAFAFVLRFIPLFNSRNSMTLLNFFTNLLALIVGIGILALIYYIALAASKNEEAALFSLALASVIPFYSWIINNALSSSIGVCFFFLIIFVIPQIKKGMYIYAIAIALPLLYMLFNTDGWIVIPLMIIYLLLLRLEHIKKDKVEEYVLYLSITASLLLALGFSYSGSILYTFRIDFLDFLHLSYSPGILDKFNFEDLLYLMGPLPVLFGMMGTYIAMKKESRMPLLLFSAIGSSFLVTLYFGSIFAYVLFSLSMVCLASFAYLFVKEKLNQSKLTKFTNSILVLITLITMFIGAVRWVL